MNKETLLIKLKEFDDLKTTIVDIFNQTMPQTIVRDGLKWKAVSIKPLSYTQVVGIKIDNKNDIIISTIQYHSSYYSTAPFDVKMPLAFLTSEEIRNNAINKQYKKIKTDLEQRNLDFTTRKARIDELLATIIDYKFQIINFIQDNGYIVDDIFMDNGFICASIGGRTVKVYTVIPYHPIKLRQVKELIKYQPIKTLIRKFMLTEAKLKTYIF